MLLPLTTIGIYASLLVMSRMQQGPHKMSASSTDIGGGCIMGAQDIRNLKHKSDFLQIYMRCSVPPLDKVAGSKYEGELIPLGILSPVAAFITNRLFGPGKWLGKFFGKSESGGNIFQSHRNNDAIFEYAKFKYCIKSSEIDEAPTLHLSYHPYNRGNLVSWGMTDELRALDASADVLIGCGGMALSGGMQSFAPFILIRK
jgi:hypothetical protein